MKNRGHLAMLSVPALYFAGQVAMGTGVYVACLFSLAILFGLYSVWAAGGLLTGFGALNAILVAKFLMIGIVLKMLIQDPADKNLLSPESTAAVMAIGFLGLLLGTVAQRALPSPRVPLIPEVDGSRMYLALTIVFLAVGYGAYLIALRADLSGAGLQTGGILGIARVFSSLRFFSIVLALYFAWSSGSRRFMTHPLVVAVLLVGVLDGIFSTSKLGAMETLIFYMLVGASRYGLRDKRLLALGAMGIFYYAAIIYPYSQYVRSHGGREGGLAERFAAIKDVFERVATNRDFRGDILATAEDSNGSYLDNETLKPFGRLAMVGEADKLVAATIERQAWSGWETITWGFKLAVPSFIDPDKPVLPPGNYLAHIAGEVGDGDLTTQVSYGVMANFFNAFAYPGVLVGTSVFFCGFYYLLYLLFGNPRWSSQPLGSTVWFLFIVTTFQHSLVEESVAGLIADVLNIAIVVLALYAMARAIRHLLPEHAAVPVLG
jgi:hypothetical protein